MRAFVVVFIPGYEAVNGKKDEVAVGFTAAKNKMETDIYFEVNAGFNKKRINTESILCTMIKLKNRVVFDLSGPRKNRPPNFDQIFYFLQTCCKKRS